MVLVLHQRDGFSLGGFLKNYPCEIYESEKGCIKHDAPFLIRPSTGVLP